MMNCRKNCSSQKMLNLENVYVFVPLRFNFVNFVKRAICCVNDYQYFRCVGEFVVAFVFSPRCLSFCSLFNRKKSSIVESTV